MEPIDAVLFQTELMELIESLAIAVKSGGELSDDLIARTKRTCDATLQAISNQQRTAGLLTAKHRWCLSVQSVVIQQLIDIFRSLLNGVTLEQAQHMHEQALQTLFQEFEGYQEEVFDYREEEIVNGGGHPFQLRTKAGRAASSKVPIDSIEKAKLVCRRFCQFHPNFIYSENGYRKIDLDFLKNCNEEQIGFPEVGDEKQLSSQVIESIIENLKEKQLLCDAYSRRMEDLLQQAVDNINNYWQRIAQINGYMSQMKITQ
jgi:hypothetical protein